MFAVEGGGSRKEYLNSENLPLRNLPRKTLAELDARRLVAKMEHAGTPSDAVSAPLNPSRLASEFAHQSFTHNVKFNTQEVSQLVST